MDSNQRKFHSQIEILDLIGDAVENAMTRRSLVLDSKDALLALLDEEVTKVTGGEIKTTLAVVKPIYLPLTVGIIAIDNLSHK